MKILIDAACDIYYSSFYIAGLQQVFGRNCVRFSSKPFNQFNFNNHFLAFTLDNGQVLKKVIVDFADSSHLDPIAHDWCDAYFKINIDAAINYQSDKLVSIGPGFGVRIFSPVYALIFAFANMIKAYTRIKQAKRFLGNYRAQWRRPTIHEYQPNIGQDGYVFFVASIWKKEALTNEFRANFIRACKKTQLNFEGGFAPRSDKLITGFEALTMPTRISMADYISKTKKSMLAFSTPAVLQCHGWKLGEFFALGKVIISTPLTRKLPINVIDGSHLIFTDGSEQDIAKKIQVLSSDAQLRQMLSDNARKYYKEHLSPTAVVEQILANLRLNNPGE